MPDGSTVYVVDDDAAVRDSLAFLLESAGLKAQAFDDAESFLKGYQDKAAGCLLLDIRLPGMSGLELQRQLKARSPQLPIIMITGHGDVTMAVDAMKQGAVDFIEKPFEDQALLDCIARVLDDHKLEQQRQALRDVVTACLNRLTPREVQVMELVVAGKMTKQIAAELNVSHKTIEVHRAHLMQKMQANTVADLVRMVMSLDEYRSKF